MLWLRTRRTRAQIAKERSRTLSGAVDPPVGFGVAHLGALPVRALSQGQKRRVALARLVLCQRRLWILDEPLAALDASAARALAARIDSHLAHGGLAVLTSHQPVELRSRTRELLLS